MNPMQLNHQKFYPEWVMTHETALLEFSEQLGGPRILLSTVQLVSLLLYKLFTAFIALERVGPLKSCKFQLSL